MIGEIGDKGFWIDDNEYVEIIGIHDEAAGLYVFASLDNPVGGDGIWIGFIEDFFPEC